MTKSDSGLDNVHRLDCAVRNMQYTYLSKQLLSVFIEADKAYIFRSCEYFHVPEQNTLHSVQFNKKLSFKVSLEVSKNIFKSRLKVVNDFLFLREIYSLSFLSLLNKLFNCTDNFLFCHPQCQVSLQNSNLRLASFLKCS